MFKKYLSLKYIVLFLILVILIVGIVWFVRSEGESDLIKVVRADLAQEVVLAGKTEAALSTQMSFDRSGRISTVSVKVGDRVSVGQTLSSLESGDLYAQLNQALANVKVQKAKLAELNKGSISNSNPEVLGAQNDLRNAEDSLVQSLADAYMKSDDAIRNLTDIFFDNPRTINAYYNLGGVTSDQLIELSFLRRDLEGRLSTWNQKINNLNLELDSGNEYRVNLDNLFRIRDYLDKLSLAINSRIPDSVVTASTLSTYRTNVSAARTEINLAISNLQSARQNVLSAKNKLDLSLSTPEELIVGESQVEEAQAQVDQIRAQISKNMIVSPISGVVTRQDAKVGETANPGVNLITVMSDGKFEITVNVPEVDVGKLALGNSVSITLDAFPNEVWSGRVSYIEPAETVVDGVVNYRVKVNFDKSDPRLKSGLTANLVIETDKKENVLVLPQYSIIETSDGAFVEKSMMDEKTEQVEVKLGIRSRDGRVEILSGVKEGDEVINLK